MRPILLTACLAAFALAGCTGGDDVREVEIHIGYNDDGKTQYFLPKEVHVKAGEKIRLVITNDDEPSARDSFHDVAFRIPTHDGLVEHEVSPGRTTTTCLVLTTPCPDDKSYFIAPGPGTYKMWCEVGPLGSNNPDGTPKTRHEQVGMWGNLVVSAA